MDLGETVPATERIGTLPEDRHQVGEKVESTVVVSDE